MTDIVNPGAPVSARDSEWAQIWAQVELAHYRICRASNTATNVDTDIWGALEEQGDQDKLQKQVFDRLKFLAELCRKFEAAAAELAGYPNWPAFKADYWPEVRDHHGQLDGVDDDMVEVDDEA
jgi:hypothetical protein